MKQFIASIFPKEFFTTRANYVAFYLAWWTVAVLVLQLFAFEKFPGTFSGLSSDVQVRAAVTIVIVELLSLPFLLSMRLSDVVRRISGMLSVLAPFIWIILSFVGNGRVSLFGAKLPATPAVCGAAVATVWLAVVMYCCTVECRKKS
ncbi:hypothetical protein EUA66_03800 [TM7 phylum sp. oral taxon 349]|nr:hypothetical protein J5A52_02070 [TM7 phylum sp. oral taxon 349]TWP21097.1 hypothetical protein EUA66_03800 [TM7 phylum sp. oral taxon 349]